MNYENKPKKREVKRTNKDGIKTKQVLKNGVIKKTVTRTPGGVEKEIERGNKRIEVQKYKDEGVKSRTVTKMKKNNQYKENSNKALEQTIKNFASDLKGSTFNRFPKRVYDNANSSQNTQIGGKISKSKPLITPQKRTVNFTTPKEELMNIPIAVAEGGLSGLGINKKKNK